MNTQLKNRLQKRRMLGNLRGLTHTPGLIDFASNDYLGLSKCLKEENLSPGSSGSRLLTGNSSKFEELEQQIAKFHDYESATIFNCGYMANLGLISAVATREDTILFDAHIHASTHDGIRLSRATAFPFTHNDPAHLEKRLKKRRESAWKKVPSEKVLSTFICIESIYSTDGSIAPLRDIAFLAKKYGAKLIVDEAHALGVFGENGKGLVSLLNLTEDVFAFIVTFGKAMGTMGAAVLGSHLLKQILINFSNPFIYTTALPLSIISTIQHAYDQLAFLQPSRESIQKLIEICSKRKLSDSSSHIQSIKFKGATRIKEIKNKIQKEGFDVQALMSPTVRKGEELLRTSLHSFNKEEELINLLNLIEQYV